MSLYSSTTTWKANSKKEKKKKKKKKGILYLRCLLNLDPVCYYAVKILQEVEEVSWKCKKRPEFIYQGRLLQWVLGPREDFASGNLVDKVDFM